ncbi:hypothetical protein EV199_2199 [Pseudobacter ginsenosidimutans]|uniref:Uncharacterized protein n=2 Tax=Pseudobacter ginsenosidimutans TaxID=661488 RepID=A0A4V2F277_9BACT|nr:hypothetical protein EV199_2199 [Pseudobacter ginsenosidimutans]
MDSFIFVTFSGINCNPEARNFMKASALLILVFFTVTTYAQNSLNNYKYVIVPSKFSFSKEENQYGLNTLAKLLLEEKGFSAFVANENMPAEVAANKCSALNAEVTERKGLFATRLTITLKDCQGNVLFKSKEGNSREKEFQPAYEMALRDAFTSFNDVQYKYDGTTFAQPQQTVIPATTPAAPAQAPAPVPTTPSVTEATGVLYAQATPNGYQLIDTTPKKVLSLFKTSVQDFYIAVDGPTSGVVFRKNEEWLYEYYKDSKLVSHKLQIKF